MRILERESEILFDLENIQLMDTLKIESEILAETFSQDIDEHPFFHTNFRREIDSQ